MPSETKVTVTFTRETCDDYNDPDLSYLEGSRNADEKDPVKRAEYDAADAERLAAYYRGDWHMLGIRARATIWIQRPGYRTNYTLESPGLWGIESDSSAKYLTSVFEEECATLRADIEAMKAAEFKS